MPPPKPAQSTPIQICQKAAAEWLKVSQDITLFPSFRNKLNRDATTCHSHLVRSGLEYAGDRILYALVGVTLMRTIPDRVHLFPTILQALRSNYVLGEYMVASKLHRRTSNKGGGDTCETVLGAVLQDRPYDEIEEWAIPLFQPMILACVAALACGKRKHEEDAVTTLDPDTRSQQNTRSHPKRPRQRYLDSCWTVEELVLSEETHARDVQCLNPYDHRLSVCPQLPVHDQEIRRGWLSDVREGVPHVRVNLSQHNETRGADETYVAETEFDMGAAGYASGVEDVHHQERRTQDYQKEGAIANMSRDAVRTGTRRASGLRRAEGFEDSENGFTGIRGAAVTGSILFVSGLRSAESRDQSESELAQNSYWSTYGSAAQAVT
ncbi:hypothetical protein DFH09DRAFT_1089361 [Mycena vulgaris]|nr:hypothetical protein DFH09DRAFT_1089361 [Mycena vulgaris]